MKRCAVLLLALDACFSVPRLDTTEELAAIAVLELDGANLITASPLQPWAPTERFELRGEDPDRTIVVGFRADQVPSPPWSTEPLTLAGCSVANLPVPAFSAHFEGRSLVADDAARTALVPRLRLPGGCAGPASELVAKLVVDARCLSPAGCARVVATRDDCEVDLDFSACMSPSGDHPGVVRAALGPNGRVDVNWTCSAWSCGAGAPRPPATSYDCTQHTCAIDLYSSPAPLPIEYDDVRLFPVEEPATPYPSQDNRLETTPYYLFEGYVQGAIVRGDDLLVVAANPPLYVCGNTTVPHSFLYRVGLDDLGVEPLLPLPLCTYSLTADPGTDGFLALFETNGWHLGRFDAVGTLTASVALVQTVDLGQGPVPIHASSFREPDRDEVGSVATRAVGASYEILVMSTVRPDDSGRRWPAILQYDPQLRKIGQIDLDRGLRPNLLIVDGDRVIVPYSEDHRIQIIDGGENEVFQLLGAVGKYTADVLPLADGGLLASANEHFFSVSPPAGGQRSIIKYLVPGGRFLTQRPWLEPDAAGHPLVLSAGASRPDLQYRATLRFFEPDFLRFAPAALDVGPGTGGRLIDDNRGHLWMIRSWDAHLLRLSPQR